MFKDAHGERMTIAPKGNTYVNNGESMRLLTLAGLGIARLGRFHVAADLQEGRLVPVLETCSVKEVEPIHAVFLGPGKMLAPRVRAFLDFLVDEIQLTTRDEN